MTGIINTFPPITELPPGSASGPANLPPVTYQYAVLGLAQTWTAIQSYSFGTFQLNGSLSGATALQPQAAASGILTFPNGPDTLAGLSSTGTFTNKTWNGATITVAFGGTGATSLTAHGILLGEGAGAIVATAAMTNGQLLVGQTGADPLPTTLSGDATLSAAGALTIANNAVTNAKAAQMAANTLKGNNTGGLANAADLTAAQAVTLLGVPTLSGANTYTGDNLFRSGKPWFDVRAFGCVGDGVTNDTANFQAAINAAGPVAGVVYVPQGNYYCPGGLTVPTLVRIQGANRTGSIIQSILTDVTTVTTNGGVVTMDNLTIYGKGVANDNGTFGSTLAALIVTSSGGSFTNITVRGGAPAILITGSDNEFHGVSTGYAYGGAAVNNLGANWFIRCAFDHSTTGVAVTSTRPYAAWAATTAYTVGQVVTTGGYEIVCSQAGTSGGVAPTLKNYGIAIVDGTARWLLSSATAFTGFNLGDGIGENHFEHCDFSSVAYSFAANINGIVVTNGPPVVVFTDCVFSTGIEITKAKWVQFKGCELVGAINLYTGFVGTAHFIDNWFVSSTGAAINVKANVPNFVIRGNDMQNGAITVSAGTSDHYIISQNIRCTVTDGGTGVNKSVTGNVA